MSRADGFKESATNKWIYNLDGHDFFSPENNLSVFIMGGIAWLQVWENQRGVWGRGPMIPMQTAF